MTERKSVSFLKGFKNKTQNGHGHGQNYGQGVAQSGSSRPGTSPEEVLGQQLGLQPGQVINPDLLARELARERPLGERATLAIEVAALLERYLFDNVVELWSSCKDLCAAEHATWIREAGYRLLVACILGKPELENINRAIFMQHLKTPFDRWDLEWRLKALETLTNGGRSVSAIEHDLARLVCQWLEASAAFQQEARLERKRMSSGTGLAAVARQDSDADGLSLQIQSLLTNLIKFNFSRFAQDDVALMLESIARIAIKTSSHLELQASLGFIDTLVKYGHVPSTSLFITTEVLCRLRCLPQYQESSWSVLQNLLRSHQAYRTIESMRTILADVSEESSSSLLKGAVQLTRQILRLKDQANLFPRSVALRAFVRTASIHYVAVDCEILIVLEEMLDPAAMPMTFTEWILYLQIMSKVSRHVFDLQGTRQARVTLGNPVAIKSGLSDDNGETELMPKVCQIFDQLLYKVSRTYPLEESSDFPVQPYVDFLLSLSPFLAPQSADFVIHFHQSQGLLSPSQEGWLDTLDMIIRKFYLDTGSAVHQSHLDRVLGSVYIDSKSYGCQNQFVRRVVTLLAEAMKDDPPQPLTMSAFELLASATTDVDDDDLFREILQVLLTSIKRTPNMSTDSAGRSSVDSRRHWRSTADDRMSSENESIKQASLRGIQGQQAGPQTQVNLFLQVIFEELLHRPTFSHRTPMVFKELLSLLTQAAVDRNSRFSILQYLLRIRADARYRIYLAGFIDISASAQTLGKGGQASEHTLSPLVPEAHLSRPGTLRSTVPTGAKSMSPAGQSSPSVDRGREEKRIHALGRSPSATASSRKTPSRDRSRVSPTRGERPEILWDADDNLPFPSCVNRAKPSMHILSLDESHLDSDEIMVNVDELGKESQNSSRSWSSRIVLPIDQYLEALIQMIYSEPNWELFSYIICLLPHQLADSHLFAAAEDQICGLRKTYCERISSGKFGEQVSLPGHVKRTDVQAVAYHTITTLMMYSHLFNKNQQEDLLHAIQQGLSRFQTTARPCIHALSVAALVLQPSMVKMISGILGKLAQVMSTATMSAHILEFLSCLARMPQIYANFTENDYKRVFGIALQYIHHNQSDVGMISTTDPKAAQSASALSQYVYIMAYHVITVWFLSVRLIDRRKYVAFITRGLLLANEGRNAIDEQAETCIDMLARCCFAAADPFPESALLDEMVLQGERDRIMTKTVLYGDAFFTFRAPKNLGWAEATVRRPSGTTRFLCKLENATNADEPDYISLPALVMLQSGDTTAFYNEIDKDLGLKEAAVSALKAVETSPQALQRSRSLSDLTLASVKQASLIETRDEDLKVRPLEEHIPTETALTDTNGNLVTISSGQSRNEFIFDPNFLFLQMSPYPDISPDRGPLPLPNDETTARALAVFDRVSVVDFHGIAVLYVAPGQVKESAILANRSGSPAYTRFISGLGSVLKLKGCSGYLAGGLDIENDIDGKHSIQWRDEVMQITFHIATLMPTDLDNDPHCTLKKRHIGNDFVSIVYNDNEEEYKFDTVPGQFNFVNIVIAPDSCWSLGRPREAKTNSSTENQIRERPPSKTALDHEFYQVSMQRRPDMPEIGPISEFKMIPASCLATFVRMVALHANIFAQVFLQAAGIAGGLPLGENAGSGAVGGGGGRIEYVSHWRERLRQIKRMRERLRQQIKEKRAQTGQGEDESSILLRLEPIYNFANYT